MTLSVFNHYVEQYPEPGQTLVHNTFTGAYVVLDERVVSTLRRADSGALLSDAEWALIDDPDLRDAEVGVVVESRDAEEAEFRAWFEARRDKPYLDCIVGINLACNFDCTYCCQAEVMDGSVMKPAVVDATASWIAKRAIDAGVERVQLSAVGGEPLLHPERIERLVTGLRDELAGTKIDVRLSLITNGYFLTPEMVQRLLPYGLWSAQVTLDGDASTHCTTRVSKKGEDTYRRIFDHVVAASRHIRIAVNGNYQPDTVHGFDGLIEELAGAGLPAGTGVSFSPALEVLSSSDGVGSGTCTWSGADTSMQIVFHDAIVRAGFNTLELRAVGPCELHDRHAYAIEPSGVIYKCPGFLGHPDWGIGHVERGFDEAAYDAILAATPKSQPCGGCSHRPNCGGGCVAAEWIKVGKTEGVNCEYDYFESIERHAAIRGFLVAIADSPAEAALEFPEPPRAQVKEIRSEPIRSTALRVLNV